MKQILIAAGIVAAAAAGVMIYLRNRNASGDVEGSLEHADHTGKNHIRKVNRKVKEALS